MQRLLIYTLIMLAATSSYGMSSTDHAHPPQNIERDKDWYVTCQRWGINSAIAGIASYIATSGAPPVSNTTTSYTTTHTPIWWTIASTACIGTWLTCNALIKRFTRVHTHNRTYYTYQNTTVTFRDTQDRVDECKITEDSISHLPHHNDAINYVIDTDHLDPEPDPNAGASVWAVHWNGNKSKERKSIEEMMHRNGTPPADKKSQFDTNDRIHASDHPVSADYAEISQHIKHRYNNDIRHPESFAIYERISALQAGIKLLM